MIEPWQRAMIRSLFPYSVSKIAVEAGIVAKYPHIPNRLYKYRSFNEFSKSALEGDAQWFSSPNKFNDPFDTTIHFDVGRMLVENETLDESLARFENMLEAESAGRSLPPEHVKNPIGWREWQRRIFSVLDDDISPSIRGRIEAVLNDRMTQENQNMVKAMSDHLRTGFSVLSLSANPLSNLMWAHYSSSHQGFCVEFDFGDLLYNHIRKRMCFPVLYRGKKTDATRYLAKAPRDFNNLFGQYLCLLKGKEWAYEQEWRIVHARGDGNENGLMSMPPPSAIFLGSEASDADTNWMRVFCCKRRIPLRRVVKAWGSLNLTLAEVD